MFSNSERRVQTRFSRSSRVIQLLIVEINVDGHINFGIAENTTFKHSTNLTQRCPWLCATIRRRAPIEHSYLHRKTRQNHKYHQKLSESQSILNVGVKVGIEISKRWKQGMTELAELKSGSYEPLDFARPAGMDDPKGSMKFKISTIVMKLKKERQRKKDLNRSLERRGR